MWRHIEADVNPDGSHGWTFVPPNGLATVFPLYVCIPVDSCPVFFRDLLVIKKTLVQVVYFRFEKWPAIREGCIPFTDRMQICRNTLKNLFDYSWPSHHTISKFSFKWKPQERGKSIDILFLFFLLNKPCYHLSPMTQPNLIPAPPFISIRIMAAFVGQGTWVSPVIPRRFR